MPLYNSFKVDQLTGAVAISADAAANLIRVILLSGSYTPNIDTHTRYHHLSAHEVNLMGATGYAAGGLVISGSLSYTVDTTNDRASWDAADVSWPSSTITARYAAILKVRASGINKDADNLIGVIDFGSNQSSSNGSFTIQWDSTGILLFT